MKKYLAGAFALLMFVSFTATTVSALPPGLAKRGLDNLPPGLAKRGVGNLPPGIQKQLMNRQEIERISPDKTVEGVLERIEIGKDRSYVKISGDSKFYEVDEKAVVWIDEMERSLARLREGMTVELEIKDGKVVEIHAQSQEIVIGTIEAINSTRTVLSVKSENTTKRYDISDADLWIDGTRSRLTALETGMEVTLKIEKDKVVEIEAFSKVQTYEGRLRRINMAEETKITVTIDGVNREFTVAEGVNLSNISIGATVTLRVENNRVVRIAQK